MKADQKSVSRGIVIIFIFISLTAIFGCKGDNWGFDLFGGDPINEDSDDSDGGDDNNGDGNNGNGICANFPPAVFSANIGGTKIN